jgi:tRNA(fMet)-specific endonuclease VapC
MKRILMDTNTYAAFKNNDPVAVNTFQTAEYVGVSVVVLGELFSGFKGGRKETRNRKELEQFLDSPRVHVIQLDEETAEFYATVYWDLKKKGKPVPTNDLWVAASAMRYGLSLFTYDGHFKSVDGLILHRGF